MTFATTIKPTLGFYLLLLISSISQMSCSNQQIYDSVQANRKFECEKLVQPQRDDCLADYEKAYPDYAKEREELLKKPPASP